MGFLSKMDILGDIFAPDYTVKYKAADGSVVALEEVADGKVHSEMEKVYYAKIADFSQLEKAAKKEHHEQWSLKPETNDPGTVRVRKVGLDVDGEVAKYFITVKHFKNEVELEGSKDFFESFRALSNNGMIKCRFEFPIDSSMFEDEEAQKAWKGLKWEVDVFFNDDGTYAEWCKIDLEVPSTEMYKGNVRPPFPIEFVEVMTGDRSKLNEEQKSFLNNLFDTVFITKNKGEAKPEAADKDTASTEANVDLTREEYLDVLHATHGDEKEKADADALVEQVKLLEGDAVDVLFAAFEKGPLMDGDVPSKSGRDQLLDFGFVAKVIVNGEDGFNAVTYLGRCALDLIKADKEKQS